MEILDEIVKRLQYNLLSYNLSHDEIKATAYAEAIKVANENFKTDYEIDELYKLKFETPDELKKFAENLPLRKK